MHTAEGASMLRTKGEAGTGDVSQAVRHLRAIRSAIRRIASMDHEELMSEAKRLGAPYSLVQHVNEMGSLPVPNFAAGGIATYVKEGDVLECYKQVEVKRAL